MANRRESRWGGEHGLDSDEPHCPGRRRSATSRHILDVVTETPAHDGFHAERRKSRQRYRSFFLAVFFFSRAGRPEIKITAPDLKNGRRPSRQPRQSRKRRKTPTLCGSPGWTSSSGTRNGTTDHTFASAPVCTTGSLVSVDRPKRRRAAYRLQRGRLRQQPMSQMGGRGQGRSAVTILSTSVHTALFLHLPPQQRVSSSLSHPSHANAVRR